MADEDLLLLDIPTSTLYGWLLAITWLVIIPYFLLYPPSLTIIRRRLERAAAARQIRSLRLRSEWVVHPGGISNHREAAKAVDGASVSSASSAEGSEELERQQTTPPWYPQSSEASIGLSDTDAELSSTSPSPSASPRRPPRGTTSVSPPPPSAFAGTLSSSTASHPPPPRGTVTEVVGPAIPAAYPIQVPSRRRAVLVFINGKSGGQLGGSLIQQFDSILHSVQVVDVARVSPMTALRWFMGVPNAQLRLLVCGGDGTVGWVMQSCLALHTMFPIGILPLGTGNDLARTFQWGGGLSDVDTRQPKDDEEDHHRAVGVDTTECDLSQSWNNLLQSISAQAAVRPKYGTVAAQYLDRVARAVVRPLDLWRITIRSIATGEVLKELPMMNYMSVGIDADIALKFHEERLHHPERFTSRSKNVLKYAFYGFEGMFEGVPLGDAVQAEVEQSSSHDTTSTTSTSSLSSSSHRNRKQIPQEPSTSEPTMQSLAVNPHWKGLIVSNVPCYHGGKNFWGDQEVDAWGPSLFNDGLLEVMGLSGTLHIGLVHLAVDQALRLAQTRRVRFRVDDAVTMQVDGEPWRQAAGCYVDVVAAGQYPMLQCPQ